MLLKMRFSESECRYIKLCGKMYFDTIILRDYTLPGRYILMQAAAALSGYRGMCFVDRRLGSSGSSNYSRVMCAEDGHLAHL